MGATEDEQAWISQSRNGDPAAFESLIRAHQPMIHSLTFRMTGSLADAEDLAQETFIRAYQQLGAYQGRAKFSSWLYRIAINACLNWRQREARRNQLHASWAESTAAQPPATDPPPDENEPGQRAQAAMLRLPSKQRAAIVLTVYEGLNHAEAARALGCTEATVSWRVFTARRKLRHWLTPGGKR
jgi:RNA polymerase sigma-70 factor, ECF subfamily